MNFSKFKDIPISFTINSHYDVKDTRYLNITIDVLHTGLNFNGSVFNKEVVNENLNSLFNTPILGYVKLNEDGSADDFTAHEYKVVKKDGDYKYVYVGHAYGVVPESCAPRWVEKISSDGKLREYLQVDALLWTKFEKAADIFKRDLVKAQSMELDENSIEGIENEDGTFTFTSFKFDGCCILSTTDERIQPAMIDSKAVANFSADNIVTEIKDRLSEYYNSVNFNKVLAKEDEVLDNEVKTSEIVEEIIETPAEEVFTETKVEETPEEIVPEIVVDATDYKVEYEKMKIDYDSLKSEFNTYKTEYQTKEADVEELRTFKSTKLAAEREVAETELFEKFEKLNGNPEFETLRENAKTYEIEALEEKCFSILGKTTANFSAKQKPITVKVPVETEETKEDPYGGLFDKYKK